MTDEFDAQAVSQFWARARRVLNDLHKYAPDHLPDHPDVMDEQARTEILSAIRELRMMADACRSGYLTVDEDNQQVAAHPQVSYQQQVQQPTAQQMWEQQPQQTPPMAPYAPSHGRRAAQAPRPGQTSEASQQFSAYHQGW